MNLSVLMICSCCTTSRDTYVGYVKARSAVNLLRFITDTVRPDLWQQIIRLIHKPNLLNASFMPYYIVDLARSLAA